MRFEYINNLRGLAIFLIVLAHSIFVISNLGELEYLGYILINSTLIFMVIGGFLFSEISSRYSYKRYILAKCKNVLLPYVVISLPAVLIYILKVKTNHQWVDMDTFYGQNIFFQYLYLMLTGAHLGPLWFIPMIIVFYLLFPLFKWINKQSFLPLIFIIALLLGMYIGRPMSNSNTMVSFLYFFPSYLFGMWLHKNQSIIVNLKNISAPMLVAVILCCLGIYYYFEYSSRFDLILKLVLSFSLFCFFARYYNNTNYILNFFAKFSFFIFFVHGYFVGVARYIISKGVDDLNIYSVVLMSFSFVMFLTILTCYLSGLLIPAKNKYILGISRG